MSEPDETLPDMAVAKPPRRGRLRLPRRDRSARFPDSSDGYQPFAASRLEDLVVITGFSGAGKSTAMDVFEDAGYFCVDNLPPEMIRALVELFVHEGSKVERAAVVSDVRGGDYFEALRAVLDDLTRLGIRHRVLFLDAEDQALLTRYKETRRRHPLAGAQSVEEGIAAERGLVEPLRDHADCVIDSTGLKAHMLRRKIADEFLPRTPAARLAVNFESFGFKHGPAPRDADLVFDVRFLPNPHWEVGLRPLTGHDARVVGLHVARRDARGVLRAPRPAAGLPAAAVRGRGQGPPDDRDRLHRRPSPLGRHRRAPRGPLPRARRRAGRGRPPRRRPHDAPG